MAHIDDQQEDKPLDPVMEGVRRKMIKLQLISGGIMAVMFLAVLVSIVYKLTQKSDTAPAASTSTQSGLVVPSDQPLALTANLPAGFRILSMSLAGSQILVDGQNAEGRRTALVYDLTLGRFIAEVGFTGN